MNCVAQGRRNLKRSILFVGPGNVKKATKIHLYCKWLEWYVVQGQNTRGGNYGGAAHD